MLWWGGIWWSMSMGLVRVGGSGGGGGGGVGGGGWRVGCGGVGVGGDVVGGGVLVVDEYGFSKGGSFWPGGVVPYSIHSSVRSTHRGYIEDAIREFEEKTAVDWVE